MMKWLTCIVAALALTASAFAEGEATPAAASTTRVRGVVKEVKADAGKTDSGTLVVTVKEEAMTFVIKADKPIKSGKDEIKLTDLKVGDKVRVDYTEADGKKVSEKIRVENDE